MSKPLRKCIKCGKEAWSEKELDGFVNDKNSLHEKQNRCKQCTRVPPKPILPYLRKCKVCGVEAKTEEDLELFPKAKSYLHNRMNICKKCYSNKNHPRPPYLRKCRKCGLEAHNEEDLKKFVSAYGMKVRHGHQNFCRKCSNEYNKEFRHEKTFKYMTAIKKSECKVRGLPFNLDHEYLESLWHRQKGCCAISGIELSLPNSNSDFDIAASLDRIDCDKGYIKGNVRWVLNCINMFKQKRGDEFVYQIAEAIIKNKPNKFIP